MKAKIVYALVCKRDDVYLAQAVVSAYTARLHNATAEIVAVVDKETASLLKAFTDYTQYFNEIVTVDIPYELNQMQKSRYLKTTLRKRIKGDFLFIDTDTIITCDLSEIDNVDGYIAAVLDRHTEIENHPTREDAEKALATIGLTGKDIKSKYFNSGVMLVRDCPESVTFYEKWYQYWDKVRQKGYNIDQPPLAKANIECGFPIVELEGTWNCQMVDNFMNYLDGAKILHYFASHRRSPYKLYDKSLFLDIMRQKCVPDELKASLDTPRAFFKEKHLLVHDDDVDFCHSSIHDLFAYHKWLYNVLEFMARLVIKK